MSDVCISMCVVVCYCLCVCFMCMFLSVIMCVKCLCTCVFAFVRACVEISEPLALSQHITMKRTHSVIITLTLYIIIIIITMTTALITQATMALKPEQGSSSRWFAVSNLCRCYEYIISNNNNNNLSAVYYPFPLIRRISTPA